MMMEILHVRLLVLSSLILSLFFQSTIREVIYYCLNVQCAINVPNFIEKNTLLLEFILAYFATGSSFTMLQEMFMLQMTKARSWFV